MKGTGRNEVNIRMKRNRWMILAAGSLLLLGACANVGAMRESDGSTQAAVLEAEDSGLVQEEAERQTEQPDVYKRQPPTPAAIMGKIICVRRISAVLRS